MISKIEFEIRIVSIKSTWATSTYAVLLRVCAPKRTMKLAKMAKNRESELRHTPLQPKSAKHHTGINIFYLTHSDQAEQEGKYWAARRNSIATA
jgi:hypothetical protein